MTTSRISSADIIRRSHPALLDRITHRCHIFEMNGESYRFRESMKAKKGRKAD
jgi:DNA replication protein DnaC